MLRREDMQVRLESAVKSALAHGGDILRPLEFPTPPSNREFANAERFLGTAIPRELRQCLSELSVRLYWAIPWDQLSVPDEYKLLCAGEIDFSLQAVINAEQWRMDFCQSVVRQWESVEDRAWLDKFAFIATETGDYVTIDTSDEALGVIVYLAHDNGLAHGKVIAQSIESFVDEWTKLGCVGPSEDAWYNLTDAFSHPLNGSTIDAKRWCRWFGLDR